MDRILQMGLDTASQFAVNFKEIQPAIYDIFSSIDVNGTQAKIVLDGIAKAAIGGATDMETAGNSIIGIMNAWGFAAEDVGHINDQMFQLVRKGRGTFQQFTAAMGKASKSARLFGTMLLCFSISILQALITFSAFALYKPMVLI
jgi:TP901 family phage tail tape measure protein